MEIFENNKPIISIIKGTAISFLATIIALTVFAVLLTYTDLSENTVKPVIITITGISILIGSSIGTRKIRKNGLITGGIIGVLYILIVYIISSAINTNFALSLGSAIMMGIGLIGGVLGGIIGVNTKWFFWLGTVLFAKFRNGDGSFFKKEPSPFRKNYWHFYNYVI